MADNITYNDYRSGRATLAALLETLHDDLDPEFQLTLTRVAEQGSNTRSDLQIILTDSQAAPIVRYAAFVALATYHRRAKHYETLRELLETYRNLFETRPLFSLFESLSHLAVASPESLRIALQLVQTSLQRAPKHLGIYAAYADIVATGHEIGAFSDVHLIQDSLEKIGQASRARPGYAKYYALTGKLCLLKGEYAQAAELINRAIDLEDSASSTYALRINEYQQLLNRTNAAKASSDLAEQITKAKEDFDVKHDELLESTDRNRIDTLSQLAFFAGIIAIIFSGTQIATSQSGLSGALLITATTGSIILAFGSFVYMVREQPIRRTVPLITIGGLLTVSSIVTLYFTSR